MEGWFEDPYFKNRISFSDGERTLQFDTAALLHSPHQFDQGSALLLQTILDKVGTPRTILDLACNYGAVGLVLASLFTQSEVVLVDKDLLAVRYATHNAALNRLPNVSVIASIGVRQLSEKRFDLIVANIPAKIGDKPIEYEFILSPLELLNPGRSYWFVAQSQLNRIIPSIARRHRLSLHEMARQFGHIVYRINKS